METQQVLEILQRRFGDAITGSRLDAIDPWIEVAPGALPDVCRFLRDEPGLRFNLLNCISGIDYLQKDPKRAAKTPWEPHVEVVYHLTSLVHKHRMVLKVILPRWQAEIEGRLPEVPTVSGIWNTANWHEREVYDLVGIRFLGHPNLHRILCAEDWEGHPLRKDYQTPLDYHGIRVS